MCYPLRVLAGPEHPCGGVSVYSSVGSDGPDDGATVLLCASRGELYRPRGNDPFPRLRDSRTCAAPNQLRIPPLYLSFSFSFPFWHVVVLLDLCTAVSVCRCIDS